MSQERRPGQCVVANILSVLFCVQAYYVSTAVTWGLFTLTMWSRRLAHYAGVITLIREVDSKVSEAEILSTVSLASE